MDLARHVSYILNRAVLFKQAVPDKKNVQGTFEAQHLLIEGSTLQHYSVYMSPRYILCRALFRVSTCFPPVHPPSWRAAGTMLE